MFRTGLSIMLVLAGLIILISEGPHPMSVLMLMVGTFALLRPLIWKMLHARRLRQLPGYGETVNYTFNPEEISICGENKKASITWPDLYEVVPNKKGLLLYHAKKSYTWIPREAFASAEDYDRVCAWSRDEHATGV